MNHVFYIFCRETHDFSGYQIFFETDFVVKSNMLFGCVESTSVWAVSQTETNEKNLDVICVRLQWLVSDNWLFQKLNKQL